MALVLVTGGCHTESNVGGARGDFQVQETELDFGRVLEGQQARRSVTVLSTGRAVTSVTASADGLFAPAVSQTDVAGGESAPLEVVFTAGVGPAEGHLVLTGAGHSVTVALRGVGVRPLACAPSGSCREAHFDLDSGTCVEGPAQDGTTCIPSSRCEENGKCQAGVCVGQPRRCNDDNPCTNDACNPAVGCVTTPVACPRPSNPCMVGICDRESGCGETAVFNLTPCGAIDCVTAHVCISGTCKALPTPEGFVCSPATPCQDVGRCHSGVCQRPDIVELEATFSQELGGEPVSEPGGSVLLSQGTSLYTSVCGGDGGCRLVSFTDTGLLRYEAPWPDASPRQLLAASEGGVVVHGPEALEAYAADGPGARLWSAPLASLSPDAGTPSMGPGRVALTPSGDVVALVSGGDAGTLAVLGAEDGGVRVRQSATLEGFGGAASVALDEVGTPYAYAQGGPVVRIDTEDGGFTPRPLRERVDNGTASLAVAGGWILAGTREFVETQGKDGGTVAWEAQTVPLAPLETPVLLQNGVGYAFAQRCERLDGTPCTPDELRLVLRAVEAQSGNTRWEASVFPVNAPGALHEAALVEGGFVAAVTENTLPTGTRSYVELFSDQGLIAACPLKGQPRVAGALFSGSTVFVVLQRDDVWRLESFDLGQSVTTLQTGWPQTHGLSGSRRATAP